MSKHLLGKLKCPEFSSSYNSKLKTKALFDNFVDSEFNKPNIIDKIKVFFIVIEGKL